MVDFTFMNDMTEVSMYVDYGFIRTSKTIEAPSVKKVSIEILGSDGVLDYTDYFGEPKYNNRQVSVTLSKGQTEDEFWSTWSELQNKLLGQKGFIILDQNDDFLFVGRIDSMSYTRDKSITSINITCDCEPYRIKSESTKVSFSGSGNVTLSNARKKVVPTITTTAETKIVFGNYEVNLSAGTTIVPELELIAGDNIMTITSTGTTRFEYVEGEF